MIKRCVITKYLGGTKTPCWDHLELFGNSPMDLNKGHLKPVNRVASILELRGSWEFYVILYATNLSVL